MPTIIPLKLIFHSRTSAEADWLSRILGYQPNEKFFNRFWSKVCITAEDECWNWKAYIHEKGYGKFQIKPRRPAQAHRVAFSLVVGPVEDSVLVCHSCDNRKCCNPKHLFLGTPQDNMNDMIEKGRAKHPPLNGELNGFSRLLEQDIPVIRNLYGVLPTKELAARFNVHRDTIRLAAKGITWKHIS